MTHKKPNISEAERKLFREAMKGLKRFKPPPQPTEDEANHSADFYIPSDIPNEVSGAETLFYAKSGLQQRLLAKLKRGKIIPEASLDLHRHTIAMAENTVGQFIRDALAHDVRCVRIIHGKGSMAKDGHAKIKNWLNIWLRQHPYVLAFHSAQPRDGGTGAVYVLLKRSSS